MKEQNLMQRMGATPGKLVLVGVLAVILVTVIVKQLPSKSDAPKRASRRPATTRPQPVRQAPILHTKNNAGKSKFEKTKSSTNTKEQQTQKPTWPDLTLESAIAFDPFAPPDWLARARKAEPPGEIDSRHLSEASRQRRKQEVLKELREQGTTMVVISDGEKRATIGEQTVRVGDRFEGFLITDITKQGVILSEIE